MATQATPFLMFQGVVAEDAMNFYVSVFEDAKILKLDRYGAEGPGPEGSVFQGAFSVGGLTVRVFDSFVTHAFSFTPAVSLFVDFDSEAELDRAYAALVEGGGALMPLGNYGFSRKYGWVNDKFGVSWQLNLP